MAHLIIPKVTQWNDENLVGMGGGMDGGPFFQQTGSNLIIRQSQEGVGGQSNEYDNSTDQVSH